MNRIKKIIRLINRCLIKPLLRFLPEHLRLKLDTLFHYIKIIFVHGHVIHFEHHVETPPPEMPDWIRSEFRALAAIEPSLYPTDEFVSRFRSYDPPQDPLPGEVYKQCIALITNKMVDMMVLTPWLSRGGADQGVLHHVRAGLERGLEILLVTTLDTESPWLSRVPDAASILEFGNLASSLSEDQRKVVLLRLILQLQPSSLHIINSQLAWEIIRDYGKTLRTLGIRTYASVYCEDYDENGASFGYGPSFLPDCYAYLTGVICDTAWYPTNLIHRYGIQHELMHTVYFPFKQELPATCRSRQGGRILWASRLHRQKRPEMLLEVASRLPEFEFEVHGHAIGPQENQILERLSAMPNVHVYGPYESLEQLVLANSFSLFLYTSGWDGLPNVLLEATAAGLPIVASAVGGVPEFINEEAGYLVTEPDVADAYVRQIRHALNNPGEREMRWSRAYDLLLSQHTWDHFQYQLMQIPGYFG